MDQRLSGVFAPITTPFLADGQVDREGLKRNMRFYAGSGLHGFLALGSNGENKSLTAEEKIDVLRLIIEGKGEHQVVMAGCIFESTRETIDYARRFASMGADFITLLPPSYFKKQMTDDALYRYFTDVADQVEKPCLVYNAPQFCGGITLSVALIRRLADHPNIVGLKDSSVGNIDKFLLAVKDRFHVMAGSANFFLNSLFAGASGGVISLANIFPDLVLDLYRLAEARDYEAAFALNDRVLQLNSTVSGSGGVAAVKKAMDLAGLAGGDPRLPLLPLPDAAVDVLKHKLQAEGLIK
ncbi:MAG: dihydrodipicolinate synthase family protein [Eubacteriales bacterium]|nr:dihydrodipicolinate synthase family protein [Eubacteriales bacterium]MDD3866972.1 dihydrodipicolinate synthase family protein [Eubacteriales bacterium]MDD4461457.1 dihydrodipicolinate synthase family protein [Eubacteriales bacterium]